MKKDLLILGGGPAGLTAGLYAARARVPVAILEKGLPGGQLTATETVDNYPGFSEPILGFELAQKMEAHAKKFGVEIVQTEVKRITPTDEGFSIRTDAGEDFACQVLILATGAQPVKLGIPGELKLAGRGVSYCAVCDGPFFRDLEVAVVGGGDSAVEEACYLTRFASKVHLIHRRDKLRAVQEIQEKAFVQPKIAIHWNSVPMEILGEHEVQGLRVRSVTDASEEVLPVGGIFFYVGLTPNSQGFRDFVDTDERGFIITDSKMACSRPGVFAAGDIRAKILRQISTAVGDGAIAAYSAQQYLESMS
ncbi:MAG: thioredoxin-disulfide reductase [Desulfomonilaceae bacterium]